jgi:hypothetical protein
VKRLLLLTALLVAAFAATALAATNGTYRGKTDQGLNMSVRVSGNLVQSVNIRWKATNCTPEKNYSFDSGRFFHTNTTKDPITQSGGYFTQKVTATIKGHGIKALVTARVHGHFSGKNVTGTEKTSARIDDKYGRHHCKTFVRFTAKR